ncbi:hypothetical protein K4L44_00295 [Halosquirtibacter laminarini]|uniref:Uncharacterized protein n=1 Tax=Halosquirtibacter laminarini TaxID=3374600 RepID=A0AC61NR32_9BACT|nr:hypothetical protein K4L44_00295 [Prolixibacteraceae bacterium]
MKPMVQMNTPGVYVVEKSAFPNSVVAVETAVPVFIGYTEKARNGGKSLTNLPFKVNSMAEFIEYFGSAPIAKFDIKSKDIGPKEKKPAEEKKDGGDDPVTPNNEEGKISLDITDYSITRSSTPYVLYYSMLLFYQNGGGPCYILSVGDYNSDPSADHFIAGIDLLLKEQEPTMIVMPELVMLTSEKDVYKVQQHALMHCGDKVKSRVAILDVFNGYLGRDDASGDVIENFRTGVGINNLDWGAAYYPWINTSLVSENSLSFININDESREVLVNILNRELLAPIESNIQTIGTLESPTTQDVTQKQKLQNVQNQYKKLLDAVKELHPHIDAQFDAINKTLIKMSPIFNTILKEINEKINLLPPSGAMAGIFSMVDHGRGVWKAPANVSLNSVVSPAVNLTHYDQEDLNVPLSGKAINAIRSFVGEGTLVWGARTMDGNSLDWRYINVRRTMIMIEQSIKTAAKAYVFEPNVANTWVTMKGMIRNFLTGIWKQGGLAGSSPEEAFSVSIGLGETMTPNDILEGIMRVTVLVAVTRPAEFIEITFTQQTQKS